MKFIIFDFEVYKHNWNLVAYDCNKEGGDENPLFSVWDNPNLLYTVYDQYRLSHVFVGFNSEYDNAIFKSILMGKNPYETSKLIIEDGIKPSMLWKEAKGYEKYYSEYIIKCFDVKSSSVIAKGGFGLSLKKSEAYMGESIVECNVPFDLDRPLTDEEKQDVERYCIHDVMMTRKIFLEEIVIQDLLMKIDMYKFLKGDIKLTKVLRWSMGKLAAEALKATKGVSPIDGERIELPDNLEISNQEVIQFFKEGVFRDGFFTRPFREENKRDSLIIDFAGNETLFGKGGIHSAKPNYVLESKGYCYLVDVKSYYPNIIRQYNLYPRGIKDSKKYDVICDKRFELKAVGDPKQSLYKLLMNIVFGNTLNKYSKLYDPKHGYSITTYGQLFLLDLAEKLYKNHIEIVQCNTDGVILQLPNNISGLVVKNICEDWEKRTRFELDVTPIHRLYQRDVNNYIMVDNKGNLKLKGGVVKQYEEYGFFKRSNRIIATSIVRHLIYGESIDNVITQGEILDFQTIVDYGSNSKFTGLGYININKKLIRLPNKVNRVFAIKKSVTKIDDYPIGEVVKIHDNGYDKYPSLSTHCVIVNEKITRDVSLKLFPHLDKLFYKEMIEKEIVEFYPNYQKGI